ncbi:hypothetical protein Ndes2437B_g06134 [Nannochloris sp. 'desiccata']|nr:hypothetical protein KSW81_008075 [Chlorella desiccata (nom. nud.)]
MREPKSFSQGSASFLALQLRLFSFIQLGSGVAFIAIACVLIWPPQGSGLAVCLWAVGALAIIAGIIGFIAAHEKSIACCLSPYITLTGLVLAAKTGLLLYLFIAPGKAVDSVVQAYTKGHANDPSPPTPPLDKIHSGIYVGRWVLLGLFGLQLVAILVALLLRCCAKRAAKQQNNKYQPFVEDLESCYNARTAEANAKLAQMKADVITAQTLKKNKTGAAYLHTEMVSASSASASQTNNNGNNNGRDTIAPYRPATTNVRTARAAGGRTGAAGQPQRSPLGPSSLSSHAPASAPTISVQSTATRDPFKPTWASKASGNH